MLASLVVLGSLTQSPLDMAALEKWREYIRPSAQEMKFEDCDWKPTFWEGVTEAQTTGKPILLWAMNGHPLACT